LAFLAVLLDGELEALEISITSATADDPALIGGLVPSLDVSRWPWVLVGAWADDALLPDFLLVLLPIMHLYSTSGKDIAREGGAAWRCSQNQIWTATIQTWG